jgi:DNA-binding transcriptional LysR family regulator
MTISDWDEIRTAYHVARAGTVSGAAQALGVHHATVIRHIDALEARLGAKLFQRHARGYTATEAGTDLLQVAQVTEDQFSQLAGRIKGGGSDIAGEIAITSLADFAPLIVPVLTRFQRDHPGIIMRYLTGARVFRMEYGEAHVAVRAGPAPQDPDNVVQPFCEAQVALFVAPDYVARYGLPKDASDLAGHRFVAQDDNFARIAYERWLRARVPAQAISFRATDTRAQVQGILAGAGLGFLSHWEAAMHPDLVQALPYNPELSVPLWLVTHVDLHRTAKVQAALAALKAAAPHWPVRA